MKKIIFAFSVLASVGFSIFSEAKKQEDQLVAESFHFFYYERDASSLKRKIKGACLEKEPAAFYTAAYSAEKYSKKEAEKAYQSYIDKQLASQEDPDPTKVIYLGRGTKAIYIKHEWYCPVIPHTVSEETDS